jgi:CheY-like chemotaxis protein
MQLEEVISDVSATVNIKLQNKPAVELITQIDPKIPSYLMGDAIRLRQVLLNLTDNAAKFTERGEITVTVKALQTMSYGVILNFSIRDTGIGLSEEAIKNLFQPFQQADASTTRKYGGTGLGLTICRKIVNMMDGELQVESIPNLGSIFSFNAYFSRPENEMAVNLDFGEQKDLNVLLVDDSESARIVLEEMLTSFGFNVTVCSNGFEAIAAYNEKGGKDFFSLLIVDWQMPGMDGLKLIEELKGLHKDFPSVLMVTAYGKEMMKDLNGHELINDMITKPVNQSALFDSINKLLRTSASAAISVSKKEQFVNISSLKNKKALLVEDNDINLELATELLLAAQMKVEVARNGIEAIKKIQESAFDIVLMDIQMPEMDGLMAATKIRQELNMTQIPILAMTAHAMKGEREKSIAAGMNDHITKPIDPDFLYAKIVEFTSNSSIANDLTAKIKIDTTPKKEISIKGIDTASGLKRAAGNIEVYTKMLRSFVERYENFEAKIELLLQQERVDEAGMLLHTIAGVSGNIGMKEIYSSALELSNSLKESIKMGHIRFNALQQHKLKDFAQHLKFYLDEVYSYLNSLKYQEEIISNEPKLEDLDKLVSSLYKSIQESDVLSIEKCEFILRISDLNVNEKTKLENVLSHLRDYEFEQAANEMSFIL